MASSHFYFCFSILDFVSHTHISLLTLCHAWHEWSHTWLWLFLTFRCWVFNPRTPRDPHPHLPHPCPAPSHCACPQECHPTHYTHHCLAMSTPLFQPVHTYTQHAHTTHATHHVHMPTCMPACSHAPQNTPTAHTLVIHAARMPFLHSVMHTHPPTSTSTHPPSHMPTHPPHPSWCCHRHPLAHAQSFHGHFFLLVLCFLLQYHWFKTLFTVCNLVHIYWWLLKLCWATLADMH